MTDGRPPLSGRDVAGAGILLLSANLMCAAIGAGIVLRALGLPVERLAAEVKEPGRQIGIRLGYMLARLFLLAVAVILVRKGSGKDAGLTALVVVVFAFTVQLSVSAINRPRRS